MLNTQILTTAEQNIFTVPPVGATVYLKACINLYYIYWWCILPYPLQKLKRLELIKL
jgi:hypothetical protein